MRTIPVGEMGIGGWMGEEGLGMWRECLEPSCSAWTQFLIALGKNIYPLRKRCVKTSWRWRMKQVLTRYHRIGLWSVMTGSKVNRKLFASSLYPASSLLHRIFYLSNIPTDFFFPFGSHRFWGEQSPDHVGSEEPSWRVMFDEVDFAFGVRRWV